MRQYIETISDSFVDFAGKIHYFIIAAISEPTVDVAAGDILDIEMPTEDSEYYDIEKVLHIGISICSPEDTFNEELGKKLAIGRAAKSDMKLFATHKGMINSPLVQALLKQEAEYLKKNPERYISGYSAAKIKYLEEKERNELEASFTDDEINIVTAVKNNPSFLDKVFKYFGWSK